MSIRNGILAILETGPTHGYGLKSRFESSTAGTWPLNVGQVYTTLGRLERDGLIEPDSEEDESGRQLWRITPEGRAALEDWYADPVGDDPPARDELAIKVLLAVTADTIDLPRVLDRQRVATMQRLQQYTRHKRAADPDGDLAWILILDSMILKAEAEIRWLDLTERRLRIGGGS